MSLLKSLQPGIDAVERMIYNAHSDGGIDVETYVYITPGEFSKDGRRLLLHTKTVEEDVSPWRSSPAEYAWYGAAVLDTETGKVVYVGDGLFYSGMVSPGNERHHGVALDHEGNRLLEYGNALTIRTLPEGQDVRVLAKGEYVYADFMDNDRYVLCMDTGNCVRVIDTETLEVLIEIMSIDIPGAPLGRLFTF